MSSATEGFSGGVLHGRAPQPWTHGWSGSVGGHVVRSADGATVANCGGPPDHPVVEGIATLIAAAPDLLAALEKAVVTINAALAIAPEAGYDDNSAAERTRRECVAAIAKARGVPTEPSTPVEP